MRSNQNRLVEKREHPCSFALIRMPSAQMRSCRKSQACSRENDRRLCLVLRPGPSADERYFRTTQNPRRSLAGQKHTDVEAAVRTVDRTDVSLCRTSQIEVQPFFSKLRLVV